MIAVERRQMKTEVPKLVELMEPDIMNQFSYNYLGRQFIFKGRGDQEEFKTWFKEYLPKAPTCRACYRPFFPGERGWYQERVGSNEDGGLVHKDNDCSIGSLICEKRIDHQGREIMLTGTEEDERIEREEPIIPFTLINTLVGSGKIAEPH